MIRLCTHPTVFGAVHLMLAAYPEFLSATVPLLVLMLFLSCQFVAANSVHIVVISFHVLQLILLLLKIFKHFYNHSV